MPTNLDGYYDWPHLDAAIKAKLAKVPDDITTIHNLLQINEPERVGANFQESLQYPSFNARRISAGWVGAKARTIVPDNATVAIEIRLVPESDPVKLISSIRSHNRRSREDHIVDHEPTKEERMRYPKIPFFYNKGMTLPFRTDTETPIGQCLKEIVKKSFKEDPVEIRILGGTVPIATFINELNVPAVIVPMDYADRPYGICDAVI